MPEKTKAAEIEAAIAERGESWRPVAMKLDTAAKVIEALLLCGRKEAAEALELLRVDFGPVACGVIEARARRSAGPWVAR